MTNILETLNNVEKTLNTPTYAEGAEFMRENLDSFVNNLTNKETPIRDRLTRRVGSGQAASWNLVTSLGVGNSAFAEGGTPVEDATGRARRSALYKIFGKVKSITDHMIAAGASFIDNESLELEVAIKEIIQDEEQLIITGDAAVTPLQFDGLLKTITSTIIDDDNNALGFRADLLNQGIEALQKKYNIKSTAIYNGFGMQRAINEVLTDAGRVALGANNTVSIGQNVPTFTSMGGVLPFINTFAMKGDDTTYAGNTVEDILIVCESTSGQPVIYMEDLYGIGKTPLGRVGAAIKFMVTTSTVLVNRAEEFQIKIKNVRVK